MGSEMCIRDRLNVGLDYLTLDRSARTLSGGEAQRIRLATQIGSCLLYTSDAADERSSVDLGGRRIIKKKKKGTYGWA